MLGLLLREIRKSLELAEIDDRAKEGPERQSPQASRALHREVALQIELIVIQTHLMTKKSICSAMTTWQHRQNTSSEDLLTA